MQLGPRTTTFLASAVGIGLVTATLAIASSVHAANGTGNYATWVMTGSQAGNMSIATANFPAATATSTSGISSPSGASAWLSASTPFGATYGSSQNKPYLSAYVATTGTTTTTITFAQPTPSSRWSFALGDVDAEQVTVSARGSDGSALNVGSWFSGTFNYCANSPRPSTCSGANTDVPSWNGSTLRGNAADTDGASGWFTPTSAVRSITLTSSTLIGIPQFQFWLATDTTIPTPPVTITAGPVKERGNGSTFVNLSGTTKAASTTVEIYRVEKPKQSQVAELVATVKSKKHKWKAPRVTNKGANAGKFCARVKKSYSYTISTNRSGMFTVFRSGTLPRGDTSTAAVVRCPKG